MPPVASTLQTVTEYAQELLDLCDAAISTTVGGPIARSYISPGRPPWDCEQITVHLSSLGDAPFAVTSSVGGGRRHITGATNLLGFAITVVRDCVPTIDDRGLFPDEADIQLSAVEGHEDVWAIWTAVRLAQMDGTLFGGTCDHLFFDGAVALDTEGGFAGFEILFRVEIAGILAPGS